MESTHQDRKKIMCVCVYSSHSWLSMLFLQVVAVTLKQI